MARLVGSLEKILCMVTGAFLMLQAVEGSSVTGLIKEQENGNPVPFATISLYSEHDSLLITGTVSDKDGFFELSFNGNGRYMMHFSFVGFETERRQVDISEDENINIGTILLKDQKINLQEIVVKGSRFKAQTGAEGITYFIGKSMENASNTGLDILKYIPGIQLDFMQNLSFEGHRNIIILVDGKVRDPQFVRQLDAGQIDKVEVISHPGPKYDGSVSGVINIITKKTLSGISGYVNTDIPVDRSVVYMFPGYGLNYSREKINLYTSYSGEISRLPVVESTTGTIVRGDDTSRIYTHRDVMQDNWSHRFNFGADYLPGKHDILNFYGFVNPYSNEYSGTMSLGNDVNMENGSYLHAVKTDEDRNRKLFGSVYYKHLFRRPGSELSVDVAYYNLEAYNATTYLYDSLPDNWRKEQVNLVRPAQNSLNTRMDFTAPLSDRFILSAGAKAETKRMTDRNDNSFNYQDNIFAAYGSVSYKYDNVQFDAGLRTEPSVATSVGHFTNHNIAWLPSFSMNLHMSKKQDLKFSYRKSIDRPNIYQLNPVATQEDLFSLKSGNPELKPGFSQILSMDYSVTAGSNFVSTRLFYESNTNVIGPLLHVNHDGLFESKVYNAGNIRTIGLEVSGALKPAGFLALNPYLKMSGIRTIPGEEASEFGIAVRKEITYECGLSAVASFGHDWVFGFRIQYYNPRTGIQTTQFSDALYFVSLDKSFKDKLKVGIVSGLPFKESFVYNGTETNGPGFDRRYQGNVLLPEFPLWFSVRYQFKSGKNVTRIHRETEKIDPTPRRGF